MQFPILNRFRSDIKENFNPSVDLSVLIIPDTHVPYHDLKAVSCMFQLAKFRKEWDVIVILGDLLDGAPVSHHMKHQLKLREGLRLKNDYDAVNKLLDRLQRHGKKIVYLQGNHELWIDRLIEENPQLDGLINVELGLRFAERGILYLPYNVPYVLGKVCFVHGLFTGQHHAKKHVEAFGKSVVYGHLHDVQMHVKVSPIDVNDRHLGLSLGCLADKNPHYMRNRPNNWTHAVGIGMVRADGNFNIDPVIISNGVASYAGKTFVG